MRENIADILDLIEDMIDDGAGSIEIDEVLDQHNLTPQERIELIKKSQEYHLNHLNQEMDGQHRVVSNIIVAIGVMVLIFMIFSAGGLGNFINSLLTPMSFLLMFFGYQLFKNNGKIRTKK